MELYRITQENYAEDISGNGSRLFGGRWNSEDNYALYASSTRALALLETLAHTPAKMLRSKVYILISLFVPGGAGIQKIPVDKLLKGWDTTDTPFYTRRIGDEFLYANKKLILEVPSVVVPEEMNFMLNPLHEGMKKVKIVNKRRIVFDSRLQLDL